MSGRIKSKIVPCLLILVVIAVAAAAVACTGGGNVKLVFMNGDEVYKTYELDEGAEITDLPMPAKTGYTFTGWQKADGSEYIPGVMPAADETVYAAYRANTYTIEFSVGDAYGSLEDVSAVYDQQITLSGDGVMSYDGKTIKGFTDLEGSTDAKYLAGSKVSNLTAEDGATVTLYAVYSDEVQALEYIKEGTTIVGFTGCAESIELPADCTAVADGAFAGAAFLKNVVIPDCYTSIGFGAFEGCDGLEKLTVPFIGGGSEDSDYLAYIFGASRYTDNQFTYSFNLITDDAGNIIDTEINEASVSGTFYIPRTLRVVTVTAPIEEFGEGAFYYAYGLEKVVLYTYETEQGSGVYDYSVKKVGAHAFEGCHMFGYDNEIKAYVTVEWMRAVEEFGDYAFASFLAGNYFTSHLMYVGELTSARTIGNNAFEYNSRISDLTFGEELISIGNRAFASNMFMQKVVIPDSVKSIGDEAFSACDYMVSVELGAGLNRVGRFAFAPNVSLKEVIFRGDQAIVFGQNAFLGIVEEDGGLAVDPDGNCNEGLKFWFVSEQGKNANETALAVYSNGGKSLAAPADDTEYYYLSGSTYGFTVTFSAGNTVYLNDPYGRSGFGLPYMVGVAEKVPSELLYDDEDVYVVGFMADRLHFYIRKTVTYTGRYSHYYNYIIPSVYVAQITDDFYAGYLKGETDAVVFGDETAGWCVKENIFGQITVLKDGRQIQLGYDIDGNKLPEEAIAANGGIAQTYSNHLPRTITYRQANMYFDSILTYYFTYIPADSDVAGTGVFGGSLLLDESKSDIANYGNYVYGDYVSADGESSVFINGASGEIVFDGTLRDGKSIEYDGDFTSGDAYAAVSGTGEFDRPIYSSYNLNDITVNGKTVSVEFKDFYTGVMDRTDSALVNFYAICDVTYDGVTYRFYNAKYSGYQRSYSLRSNGEKRGDCYTLISYERQVTSDLGDGNLISVTEYPGYVEFEDGSSVYKFGSYSSDYDPETGEPAYVFTFTSSGASETVIAILTDLDLGTFTVRVGATDREYLPFFEEEADMTFTNGRVSIYMDGYGNGKYFIDGVEQWSGKYSINPSVAVANVFITENTYYTMYEYTLVSSDRAHTVYFTPNFYDAYDGTLKKGDMLLPDETRNKSFVSRVEGSSGEDVYTSVLACSGYGMAMLYILTAPDGTTVPIDLAQMFAPGITYVNYEKREDGNYGVFNLMGEGLFICELTENMVQVSDNSSYREMIIGDDYAGWWYDRVAVQISGKLNPNMYDFERLTSRDELGVYTTPDGYKLSLDGKGGAVLYDNSGAMQNENILATGAFESFDAGVMSPTNFRAELSLTFTGDSAPTVFEGVIYAYTGYAFIPVTLKSGKVINGFAKDSAVEGRFTEAATGNVITVYTDGAASIYNNEDGTVQRGVYGDYEANPDPENEIDKDVAAYDGLKAIRVDSAKIVVEIDEAASSYEQKGKYGLMNFKPGLYVSTVYNAYQENEPIPMLDDDGNIILDGNDIVYKTDEDGNPIYYSKTKLFGFDVRGELVDGVVVPAVNSNSEYVRTDFMFYTEEEKAEGKVDYYRYYSNNYDLTWQLYEDGEYIFNYVYMGIIDTQRTGWYYIVGEGASQEHYFVLNYSNGIVKYTLSK